ncbi:hypothetical protein [Nocardia wallacei]|nr:hypothetical protein [Nocardia wallacei]
MTPEQLAARLEVDPKTVQRWISTGRVPYPRHQFAVAAAVGVREVELWPNARVTASEELRRAIDYRRAESSTPEASPYVREQLDRAGLSVEELAQRAQVDPRVVQDWATGAGRLSDRAAIRNALDTERGSAGEFRNTTASPAGGGYETSARDAKARMRALMSWVDQNAPVKEREIHSPAPESPSWRLATEADYPHPGLRLSARILDHSDRGNERGSAPNVTKLTDRRRSR